LTCKTKQPKERCGSDSHFEVKLRIQIQKAIGILNFRERGNPMNQKLVAKIPWSARFIAKWIPFLSADSVLSLRQYTIKNERGLSCEGDTLTLRLRQPLNCSITIREKGSDILTFEEVIAQQIYRPVLEVIKSCRFVIDLGGNIGLSALYFAAHYPDSQILIVEPSDSSHQLLVQNLSSLVAAGRCQIIKAAVWNRSGQLLRGEMSEPHHFSKFRIQEMSDSAATGGSIMGLSMMELLKTSGFPRVDLLKIDIEGAEVKVFEGDLDWLDLVRAIAIEFHGDSRTEIDFDNIMKRRGFRLVDDGNHTVIAFRSK
jgi:FkbM family methyltransferase